MIRLHPNAVDRPGAAYPHGAAEPTDGELLGRFAKVRDRAALELLVRRHGPMVFGVCRRVIGRHLLPSFMSHLIASATLSIPGMILAESTLSFLNLGLRPPLISWGVLLEEARNLESLRHYPWLLSPAVGIAIAVLAFNFFGDGLRDASDPYTM